MSSGSGSYFQKVPVSDPAFFLTKYDLKGPKMAFQNIIFKDYLNLVYKNGQNYEITPFLMVFVNVHIHFRLWTLIRNSRVTDPVQAKVPDPDPQHCEIYWLGGADFSKKFKFRKSVW
jgi:hypothetical protein